FIAWGMGTDARTALAHVDADLAAGYSHGGPERDSLGSETPRTVPAGWISPSSQVEAEALCRAVSCPILVIQGELDAWRPLSPGARLAELTAGQFVVLEGYGSAPHGRHPGRVKLLLK